MTGAPYVSVNLSIRLIHAIIGGKKIATSDRNDGGVWRSVADVVAMIEAKDVVFALNERDGHRLPSERLQVPEERLQSELLSRLAEGL